MPFLSVKSSKPDFGTVLEAVEADAPTAIRRERLRASSSMSLGESLFMGALCAASVSFCVFAVAVSVNDPDYFSRRLIASFQKADVDPITTGTVVAKDAGSTLPAPVIERSKALTPQDYQIVMVFQDEAILATDDELMRVKVGSVLPGLGTVKEIVPNANGGTVAAEDATLKSGGN
jgi:hypothetical protein